MMFRVIYTLFLASAASGQLTATFSAPDYLGRLDTFKSISAASPVYVASVIDVAEGATTLQVALDDNISKNYRHRPEVPWTWIIAGTTSFRANYTTTPSMASTDNASSQPDMMTSILDCAINSATATCTDALLLQSDNNRPCSPTSGTEVPTAATASGLFPGTIDGTATMVSSTTVIDLGWCKTVTGPAMTDILIFQTTETYTATAVQVVITAGEEKLSGTQPTGGSVAGPAKTGTAPMMTMAPVLAGLGVAAAALVL